MAAATSKKKPAASTSKAVAKWDEELAKYAETAAKQEEGSAGGAFFSTKSGVLSFQDAPLPGNEMAVIILDSIFENLYYEGDYDPDNPQGPTAFALGRDEDELRWHENSAPEFAGELCSESEVNQWGSADKGRGKACKNTRRLALIPAGQWNRQDEFELIEDEEHYRSTQMAFMKLPVTSVKGFAGYVRQVAGSLKRPPFAVVTRVYVEPDPKTQYRVLFEVVDKVPDSLLDVIMERREEAMATIDFPYPKYEEQEAPAPKGRGGKATPKGKTAPKGATAAKPAGRARKY